MSEATDGAGAVPGRPALRWIVLPVSLAVVLLGCLGAQVVSPGALALGSTARLLIDRAERPD